MRKCRVFFTVALACAVMLLVNSVQATVILYTQDFESIGGGILPWSTLLSVDTSRNLWSAAVDGTDNHWYENILASSGSIKGMSSILFPSMGLTSSANNFKISTVLKPISIGIATASIYPSTLQISQPLVPGYGFGKSYLFEVLGSYNVSNALTFTFNVKEAGTPANTQYYMFTDTTLRTCQWFGFYSSFSSGASPIKVDFTTSR